MKWLAYPDKKTRDNDTLHNPKGIEREGQVIADAPGAGNRWCLIPGDNEWHKVNVRQDRATEIDETLAGQQRMQSGT